jgi:hypothetical protein
MEPETNATVDYTMFDKCAGAKLLRGAECLPAGALAIGGFGRSR